MAIKEKKNPQNVDGAYYTDSDCIACDSCSMIAPNNFKLSDDNLSFVYKQPASQEEKDKVEEALSACPVGSIGDDGESES